MMYLLWIVDVFIKKKLFCEYLFKRKKINKKRVKIICFIIDFYKYYMVKWNKNKLNFIGV